MTALIAHHEALLLAQGGAVVVAGATATQFWRGYYRVRARLRARREAAAAAGSADTSHTPARRR